MPKAETNSVHILTFAIPNFIASITFSSGVPDPPCRTSGKDTLSAMIFSLPMFILGVNL
jgi:hypothetical protein